MENATPKPQSAILLSLCLLALLLGESYWLYQWHLANEDLLAANVRRAGQNAIDQRKIMELRGASVKIDGLYLRLQDPLTTTSQTAQPGPLIAGRHNPAEPLVIQDFTKAGLSAVPSDTIRSEPSVGYQLGSNQLEFQRLVPLIVQEENTNVFLFIDHLEFARPRSTAPFSLNPTALQARFTARMFTSSIR